jgi:hypothetical protein
VSSRCGVSVVNKMVGMVLVGLCRVGLQGNWESGPAPNVRTSLLTWVLGSVNVGVGFYKGTGRAGLSHL